MNKIIDTLKDNNSLLYGFLGVTFLAGYFTFGRKLV